MAYSSNVGVGNVSFNKMWSQLIIRTFVAAFITLIIYLSISTLINGFNYKALGYDIYYFVDEQTSEKVYTYMYTGEEGENWVDEGLQQFLNEDGSLKTGYYQQTIPNKLSDKAVTAIKWISQAAGFTIWCALIYIFTWSIGNADADKAEFGGKALDKNRALKASLIALIPFALSYLALVISKVFGVFGGAVSAFKIINYATFAFNDAIITGTAQSISLLGIIALILVLLPMPIAAVFGYRMGNKHIILKEKVIYKNEKQ